jgi:hypothetical protein
MKIYIICPRCDGDKLECISIRYEIACCLSCGHEFFVPGLVSPLVKKWRNDEKNVIKMDKTEKIVNSGSDHPEIDSKKDQNVRYIKKSELIRDIDNLGVDWEDLTIEHSFIVDDYSVDAIIIIDYQYSEANGLVFDFTCSFYCPPGIHQSEIQNAYSTFYDRVNWELYEFLSRRFDFLDIQTESTWYEYNENENDVIMSFYAECD